MVEAKSLGGHSHVVENLPWRENVDSSHGFRDRDFGASVMVSVTGISHGFRDRDFVFAPRRRGSLVFCSTGCGSERLGVLRRLDRLPFVRWLRPRLLVDVGQAVSRGP